MVIACGCPSSVTNETDFTSARIDKLDLQLRSAYSVACWLAMKK